jgi:hypothetical protein
LNLAITTTGARTWEAVKRHYLIAVAGGGLALAAIVGGAAMSGIHFGSNANPAPALSNISAASEIVYAGDALMEGADTAGEAVTFHAARSIMPAVATHLEPAAATAAELATVYFLVDSEAQRSAVFRDVERQEWVVPLNQAGEYQFVVLLAGTPEDETRALSVLADEEARLMAANADMKVIDLRSGAAP